MADLAAAQAEIARLREQLSVTSSEAETRINAMKKQQSDAKARAKALIQRQREQAQERVGEVERELEKQRTELTRLKDIADEKAMFKERASELEALVVKGMDDLQKVLGEKKEAGERLKMLEAEVVKVKEGSNKELMSVEGKVAELEEQLRLKQESMSLPNGTLTDTEDNNVKKELEAARESLSSLESVCEGLRKENERLLRDVETKERDKNEAKVLDDDGVERSVEELRMEMRQVKERADLLELELRTKNGEQSAKQKELENTLGDMRVEKNEMEEKLSKSEKRVAQLEDGLKRSEQALQEEKENLASAQRNASERAEGTNEGKKILEAKIAEMERVIAAKQMDLVKVREKARAYLKDINAEKREMEDKLKQEIKGLQNGLQEEQKKGKEAEQRAESTTTELDNCLLLIREKQKSIQMLKMAVSTEQKALEEAQRETESVRAEFVAYKERARLALQQRDSTAGSSQDAVEEATSTLRLELDRSRKEVGSLRHQVESLKNASSKVDELVERAEKAETALDLLRKDTTGVSNANYAQIDALEEKVANAENELRAAEVALGDSEDRHETTKMRLEATERALRSAEVRAEEAGRLSAKTIDGLRKQVEKVEEEANRANKSAAAAQRTAAVAARALSFTSAEDPEQKSSSEKQINRSPLSNEKVGEEFSPYSNSGNSTVRRTTFITAMEDHSESLGLNSHRANLHNREDEDLGAEVVAKAQQITVLTEQVAELGVMLDEAQQETNLKSEQTALLKTEVKNLDAKLAAAEKLQNGAPFSYLRAIVVRYLETEDSTLLPVISNVLSFTDDESARVKASRGSRSSTSLPVGPQKSGYFSLPFLGSR